MAYLAVSLGRLDEAAIFGLKVVALASLVSHAGYNGRKKFKIQKRNFPTDSSYICTCSEGPLTKIQ